MTCPFFFLYEIFMIDCAAIILAAGKGTRMKSDLAKVLHEVCGVPMIRHVVETAETVVDHVVVVVGHQAEAVRQVLTAYPALRFALQEEQLGTGHAVMAAMPEISPEITDVVILCGDTPLIKPKTLRVLIEKHRAGSNSLTLLGTTMENPFGYGRIVCGADGGVVSIVEEADAGEAEKMITTVNTGTYCINIDFLKKVLPGLTSDNAQGEFYLTDVVAAAHRRGVPASLVEIQESLEVLGVNSREDLAMAERIFRRESG